MAERIGPNVLALFEDTMTAHEAILALERSGIDGGEIKLVADHTHLGADELTQRADRELERQIAPRVVLGAAVGAVVGALLGLIGVAIWGELGLGAVLGGALFASAVGGLIGLFTRLGGSEAWSDTLGADDSASVVAVTSNDHAVLERATDLLANAEGLQRIVVVGAEER
jgi:uncharacterized membrane protein